MRTDGERELQETEAKLSATARQQGVQDLSRELHQTTVELEATEMALALARRNEPAWKAQLEDLEHSIEQLTAQSNGDTRGTPQRLQRLQQLILEERQNQQIQVQLQAKVKEYETVHRLFNQKAVSAVEHERLKGEVAALEARLFDSKKVEAWKLEVNELERQASGSPLLQQVLAKKVDLGLQVLACRRDQVVLAADLETRRRRFDKLQTLQTQVAPVTRQIERLTAERQRLQGLLDQLRVFRYLLGGEAFISQPALATPRTFGELRGWVMGIGFACGSWFVWLTGLVLFAAKPNDSASEEENHDVLFLTDRPAMKASLQQANGAGVPSHAACQPTAYPLIFD